MGNEYICELAIPFAPFKSLNPREGRFGLIELKLMSSELDSLSQPEARKLILSRMIRAKGLERASKHRWTS